MLFDKLTNKVFLSKNNQLAFEIEDEYIDWKKFLINIDNQRNTQQLLNDLSITYNKIEPFLKMSIEEKIFSIY